MPIRPEFRHFYRGRAWRVTRERILSRADYACENCGKPDGVLVETVTGKVLDGLKARPYMYWRFKGPWRGPRGVLQGEPVPSVQGCYSVNGPRKVRVVLTIGHRNHTPGDDRDENLAAWCQWCHFHHDTEHHHETRGARKDASRPILAAAAESREVVA